MELWCFHFVILDMSLNKQSTCQRFQTPWQGWQTYRFWYMCWSGELFMRPKHIYSITCVHLMLTLFNRTIGCNLLKWFRVWLVRVYMPVYYRFPMITSWHLRIFRIGGPLRGEITGNRWVLLTKAINAMLDVWFVVSPNKLLEKDALPVIWDVFMLLVM